MIRSALASPASRWWQRMVVEENLYLISIFSSPVSYSSFPRQTSGRTNICVGRNSSIRQPLPEILVRLANDVAAQTDTGISLHRITCAIIRQVFYRTSPLHALIGIIFIQWWFRDQRFFFAAVAVVTFRLPLLCLPGTGTVVANLG